MEPWPEPRRPPGREELSSIEALEGYNHYISQALLAIEVDS